jgi:hypothetical protein
MQAVSPYLNHVGRGGLYLRGKPAFFAGRIDRSSDEELSAESNLSVQFE